MPTTTHPRPPAATAWYDSFQAFVAAAAAAWRPWGTLNPRLAGSIEATPAFEQIAEDCRTLAEAQVAVADALLRTPFWLTGAASSVDLYDRSAALVAA
jgi:hypothetical protein